MIASRQLEIPLYKIIGQACGRGLDAFAQFNGRKAIRFQPKFVFSASKRVVAALLAFTMLKRAEIVSG